MSKVKISYDEAVKLGLTKKCSKCGEVESVAEFNRNKTGKYGAESMCKKCRAKYKKQHYQEYREEINNRQRKYNQEHKEEKAKYNKKHYQEHREEKAKYYQEHREEIANRQRKYNQEHREEIVNRQRKYYQEHREEIVNYQKQYDQTPQGKENKRKRNQKHRASKNNSFYQTFTQEDREFCLNYFNCSCPYSGKPLTYSKIHIDHIIALSDKDGVGATAPWNLILCDSSTNKSKHNKPVLEFINSLPNPEEVYSKIRNYIILQAKRYIDIIPEDDITLKTFNISFEEIEG